MSMMRSMAVVSVACGIVVSSGVQLLVPAVAAAAPCSTPTARGSSPQPPRPDIEDHVPKGHEPEGGDSGPARPLPRLAGPTQSVGWVTGPMDSPNDSPSRFGISGTDLGIMWDNGQSGPNRQVLMAFGDTFGNCSVPGGEWRSNTLMRSGDTNLADGISVPNPQPGNVYAGSPVNVDRPNFSRQIIARMGLARDEVTVIPTAGISVGTTQYVNFMSVKSWGAPGQWITNFSAIAVSNDNGETWTPELSTIRQSGRGRLTGVPRRVVGDQNFQMGAFVKSAGFVYQYGTPSGRSGPARVARVPEAQILDLSAYEYWNGRSWIRGKPSVARQVINGPVSEMSVQWNDHLGKFVALYTSTAQANAVVMRTAPAPEGPWSPTQTLVTSQQVPGLYSPYIHPWSSGSDLYFTLSVWSNYNVMLMRTRL